MEELHADLQKTLFVSVINDTSNRKDVKLAPIVVRFFLPLEGVQVKLLDFESVHGETSEILTENINLTLRRHEIDRKIAAFCGDNCNTNFGGVHRRGQNNVYSPLNKNLELILSALDVAHILCTIHFKLLWMVCQSKLKLLL